MWLLVLLVVAAVIYFFYTRNNSQSSPSSKRQHTSAKPANPFRAISIVCGEAACATASMNAEKRYLLAEAPQLPLAGCAEGRCGCRYQHHADRRSSDNDRRLNFGLSQELHGSTSAERRKSADRRKLTA